MYIPQNIIQRLDALDVYEVANRLGIQISKNIATCFMHKDEHPSLRFKHSTNSWRCFVCDKGGHSIELVKQYKEYTFQEACIWLAHKFNVPIPNAENIHLREILSRKVVSPRQKKEIVVDEEVLNWIISVARLSDLAKKFLFEERKYSSDAVSKVHVGSISDANLFKAKITSVFSEKRCLKAGVLAKGKFGVYPVFRTPCLLFPFYDENGHIRNIQSRYLGDNKDKKIARFNNCIGLPPIMFNLPVLKATERNAKIYVAEGVTDCLAYLSEGKNSVALPGVGTFQTEYARLLADKTLFIYVDNDKPGKELYEKMNKALNEYGACIHNIRRDNLYKDYSELYIAKQNGTES